MREEEGTERREKGKVSRDGQKERTWTEGGVEGRRKLERTAVE